MEVEGRQLTAVDKTIRKIRKKLRQIEHLKLLDRDLNEEETSKIRARSRLIKELRRLVKEHRPDEADVMKRTGTHLNEADSDSKKVRSVITANLKEVPHEPELHEAISLTSSVGTEWKQEETPHIISSGSFTPPYSVDVSTPTSVLSPAELQEHSTVSVKTLEVQQSQTVSRGIQQIPDKPQNLKKNVQESKSDDSEKRKNSLWRDSLYEVYSLEGHNDIILAVDCMDDFVLSASRDTTVRVWRVGKTIEERSLRGHTAAVTSVAFLPATIATAVVAKYEEDKEELPSFQRNISSDCSVLAVSGGLDCTLKVWDILSGEGLGSIYTYNGITRLRCGAWGVVTGTEGGKLEVWCVATSQQLAFVNAFQSQVTTLCIEGDEICAGSADGDLGVWRFDSDSRALQVMYIMETGSSSYVLLRRLAALVTCNGKCYLGDNGPNIKVLDRRKGHVSRLVNHVGDIGMTDSLAVSSDGCLLAASYFVDSGCPSINVREISSGRYICTLIDKDEGRILAMSTSPGIIVTGGHLLKVWLQMDKSTPSRQRKRINNSEVLHSNILHKMSRSAVDSNSEDDTDWASSSDDEDIQQLMSARRGSSQSSDTEEKDGWWCRIL